MNKSFLKNGVRGVGAASALLMTLMTLNGCYDTNHLSNPAEHADHLSVPPSSPIDEPIPAPGIDFLGGVDFIELMLRTDPREPQNERFLDDWYIQAYNVDDQGRRMGPTYYGDSNAAGNAALPLPGYMFSLPLVINAYNEAYPLNGDECRDFQIFVPAYCYDKAIWLLGPVEDALWRFYRQAAEHRGEAWNPSQVDCATWLANLQLLIGTDKIDDGLDALSSTVPMVFDDYYLIRALQENQQLLTPTRPPICMAERRHDGGGLKRGDIIPLEDFPYTLDDANFPDLIGTDVDPITIGVNGLVDTICGFDFDASLTVNGAIFTPTNAYVLNQDDFLGTISDQEEIQPKLDVSTYNVRAGNGRELDADKYDDACSLTTQIKFTNKDDDEQDIILGSGVTFLNLFDDGLNTAVYFTSSGDAIVDETDTWIILYDTTSLSGQERVIEVTLLGHREKNWRDALKLELNGDDLFVGLRADFELNEEASDGEYAYLGYTVTVWDGSTQDGRFAIRENIADCYEAADVWARQFFITRDFQDESPECCADSIENCIVDGLITPFEAAEFAARSECFSNSRANQRWQSYEVGLWSMNSSFGVQSNLIINPGWLAPNLNFEIFVQNFDEAVFQGPVTVRKTDYVGQLIAEMPTLVEGDRVLIRAEDSCCDDYELVVPCVPEFTGFVGAPGIPFVPTLVGPPPVPVAAPVVDAALVP